ncbi:MAG: hypothetical protein ACYTHK_11405 [Planctomycetota bacterium]|jgi:hypothetical protein
MSNGRDEPDWGREMQAMNRRINIAIIAAIIAAIVSTISALLPQETETTVSPEVTQYANPVINVNPPPPEPVVMPWPYVQCDHYDPIKNITYTKSAESILIAIREAATKRLAEEEAKATPDADLIEDLRKILEHCAWYLSEPQAGSTDPFLHGLWCAKIWDGYLAILEPDGDLLTSPDWEACRNELEPPE